MDEKRRGWEEVGEDEGERRQRRSRMKWREGK